METFLLSAEVASEIGNVEDILASLENSSGSVFGIVSSLAGIVGILGSAAIAVISITLAIIGFIWMIITYLIPAIALFVMARRAGYKNAWFAFIPFLQTYLEYMLPKREFKVLFLKFPTEKRQVIALIAILASVFGTAVIGMLNVVPAVGQILDIALAVFLYACAWRKMYDMLCTFGNKEAALPVSVFSLILPIVYAIALVVCMKNPPDYGEGCYYMDRQGFVEQA